MPQIIGKFTGSVSLQTAVAIPDTSLHALVMASVTGHHESQDTLWDGAAMTYWGYGDLLGGSGKQSGYFQNKHVDGETTFGSFEGDVTISGFESIIHGKWQLTKGTGRYSGIAGGGSFEARSPNPVTVHMSWSGEYSLPSEKE